MQLLLYSSFSDNTIFVLLVATMALNFQGCTTRESGSNNEVILEEFRLHPRAHVSDIYKLIYQGEFGVAHLVTDESKARQRLMMEIANLDGDSDPLLYQICNADRSQYRIYLGAYISAGYDLDLMLEAMLESAQRQEGEIENLAASWKDAGEFIKEIRPELHANEYNIFTTKIEDVGYDQVHHSSEYRKYYKPAYRVIDRKSILKYFPEIFNDNKDELSAEWP
jgi:hypothetical protein